ncbi:NAD-dependent epimerase/dehydratase family protein [Acidithiobacillus sp. CV18-2]|uniref:NAD-dependent epimerase/dehydratase family protein n=1 Tax=Igneacidithiobacillus copahuensis TaxID=2724909 RepID=A0AAE2YRY0_9PROT|nr:GDP-mannose 4,6-dehydratase [Igneacidithiobacillus copahuensis]MBU2753377.1 NAD-dependent epimerase/dehydratase family protein [Acidithiobacillus sp. CV18-3]MBU2756407.1 NAD-dependent epimerase/dehydratase family protein [Acidithiobacillus sp. BN09-2]MBU2776194.1 NAD-dependent epimerase/dehydratase family protein [Acidithiobacillus sp. CV18-2]MBU2795678.1 NAD-dependent epimerase/dehydratase family protein [Acidithiobacillus sp. VAN18-2]MBU2798322.1 NAD-dependent epimerase/dehydratase family
MEAEQPTVLITGLHGFTGCYLAERLRARGARVVGLVQPGTTGEVSCDLTDAQAVRTAVHALQPTHVAHLAAFSFVGHEDVRGIYDVNLLGTLDLLEALSTLPTPPQRILLAGSANIYGTPNIEVIDESICPAPVNHYAISKLGMELMARNYASRLPLVITRPFNYSGRGQSERFLIPKIVSHALRKARIIELGNLDVSRDFSDVRDVAAIYTALLLDAPDAVGKTFNICSGQAYSLREILQMVEEISGHSMEVRVNPDFVRSNEVPRLLGSNALLRQHTGLAPQIPLRDTLRWMLTV